jgi:hypothetical protein
VAAGVSSDSSLLNDPDARTPRIPSNPRLGATESGICNRETRGEPIASVFHQ